MKTGFTFKGRHSDEFGLVMKTSSRPIHPEMKSYTYDSPLTDGVYDFSSANSYGRAFYQNRIFTLIMQIYADDLYRWVIYIGGYTMSETVWMVRFVKTQKLS